MDIIPTILTGLAVGWILTVIFEFILKHNKKLKDRYYRHHEVLWGYHIHHSIYGLIMLVVSAVVFFKEGPVPAIFYGSIGIGIIAEHTISERQFVFISNRKK